jgi:hypothetical protein
MADERGQVVEVPVPLFRDAEEYLGPRLAGSKTDNTAVRGVKELLGFAKHVAKRILRLTNSFQMGVQMIEKFEGRKLLF